MPIISAVGKRSPTSTTRIRSSISTTVMFLPISPRPPSGSTRKEVTPCLHPGGALTASPVLRTASCCAQHSVSLEGGPHERGALLVGLDQGQAHVAAAEAEQLAGFLDRDRVAPAGGRVGVLQVRIDLGPVLRLVDQPAHLVAEHVRGYEDPALAAHVEHAREG